MGAPIIDTYETIHSTGTHINPELPTKVGFFDRTIEILLFSLLVLMPLAFGAVQAWSEQIVIIAAGAMFICFCLKLILCPQQRLVRTWAYIPVLIFILIAVLQLVPLPREVVSVVSPNTMALRTEMLSDLSGSDSSFNWMPLSLYPAATKHDLRLVLAVAAIFVVVLNVFRQPEQIKRLLWWIALIGGSIAAITLAQNLFGNGKIYWFIATPNSKGYSGPFINHSNYGQFMNLSMAAAIGILIWQLHEVFSRKRINAPEVLNHIGSPAGRWIWLLVGIIGICLATVFLSLTRGGIISMLAAMGFTVLILARRKSLRSQGWLFVIIALLAFTCVLYAGFDAVFERLSSLRNLGQEDSGRMQILKDIAVAWKKFPLFGTGLGTHRYVYPMFDRSYIVPLAGHAENEYAQVLEETGLLGLVTLVVFLILMCTRYLICICKNRNFACSAAYGLGFGILAILIHSMADFGQHLPANSFLTVIFCAILVILAKQKSSAAVNSTVPVPCRSRRWMHFLAISVACSVWFWSMSAANGHRVAEENWNKAKAIEEQLVKTDWKGPDYQYSRLIRQAQAAVDSDPEDIYYRYWLNVYKYRALGGKPDPYNDELVIDEAQLPQVHKIAEQLRQICMLCPTFGPAYSTLGQIEKYVLYDESGADRINRGFYLAKNNPVICFVAACSDASEGDIDSAQQKFTRAIRLDGRLYKKAAMICIDHLSRPDLAIALAGENIRHLHDAHTALDEAQYTDYAQQARDKIIVLLEEKCTSPTAVDWEHRLLGLYYKKEGKNEKAIECYRKAVKMNYSNVDWHFELADLLAKCDKTKQAMYEAKICLQLSPGFTAAKNLLADCSIQPVILNEAVK